MSKPYMGLQGVVEELLTDERLRAIDADCEAQGPGLIYVGCWMTRRLVAEVLRLRAGLAAVRNRAASWDHAEDCNRSGHENCWVGGDGSFHCDQDDERAACEALRCDCGRGMVDDLDALIAASAPSAEVSK